MDDNNLQTPDENPRKIVVVSGDGKDLEISDVHDHLNIDKPLSEHSDDKEIVIPPDNSNQ